MNHIYIALDLETTGFLPDSDQVLEIAAIKFQDHQILDRFETLINPGIPIPAMVTHITGITPEDVTNAPSFEDISQKLSSFLGNHTIIGHNIEFDLTFLEAKGIPILNQQIDTLKLASILLPHLPSLSLDTISRQLKIPHPNKHRAMADAQVCVDLFHLLKDKISDIPAPTLHEIQNLLPRATWELSDLFSSVKPRPPEVHPSPTTPENPALLPHPPNSTDELLELLSSTSPLAQNIAHYEHRPGQQKLLNAITSAIQNKHHLLAEAGTGTGKTMAYLLAAAYSKHQWQQKTIISTHTNPLQDQILYKDFPLIKRIFPEVKIAMLKGRKKYLSLERFNRLKQKPQLDEHELTTIIKVLLWLDKTSTGDLDELHLQNKETLLYEEICCDPEHINSEPTSDNQKDFLSEARRKAEAADIVIANHALLIQDRLADHKILPESSLLIIDEAHHLEKTVTDAMSTALGNTRLQKLWDRFTHEIDYLINQNPQLNTAFTSTYSQIKDFRETSINMVEKSFYHMELTMEKFARTLPGIPTTLNLNKLIYESLHWQNAINSLQTNPDLLINLRKILHSTTEFFLDAKIRERNCLDHLKNIIKFHQTAQDYLNHNTDYISWLSRGFDESLHWHIAPLAIQSIINQQVFSPHQSVILTSATLSTLGNFSYIRSELGLDENFNEIIISSHFSYPDQVQIIIPEDMADPRDPTYINQCEKIIHDVIVKNGGRTLALFTAKKDLSRVFHNLAPQLKTSGISLLGQNLSGGRGKIIAHFQDEPGQCAILGTNSFWEGVDLTGDILNCVIIQKLPFDPPEDPIILARSSRFEKPFEQFSLPRAILRFKQGFGRLIRSSRDTGSVIILDSRLIQKPYGKDFISSLPTGISIHQCPQKEVAQYL